MEKEFVPYELAVKLKELGFDEHCMATISNIEVIHIKGTRRLPSGAMCTEEVNAPLWQQAFKFILTKVNMKIDSHNHYTLGFDGEFLIDKNTWIDYEGYHIDESYVSGNVDSLKFLIELVEHEK